MLVFHSLASRVHSHQSHRRYHCLHNPIWHNRVLPMHNKLLHTSLIPAKMPHSIWDSFQLECHSIITLHHGVMWCIRQTWYRSKVHSRRHRREDRWHRHNKVAKTNHHIRCVYTLFDINILRFILFCRFFVRVCIYVHFSRARHTLYTENQ